MSASDKRYSWSELQAEYPAEWCALIDVVRGEDRRVPLQTARLLYHGNRDEASDCLIDVDNRQRTVRE